MSLEARALFRLEAELEYGVTLQGDSIPVTSQNTRDVPLLTVARFEHGIDLLFREGLSEAERVRLMDAGPQQLFEPSADTLPYRVIDCRWYVIARIPERIEFPDVIEHTRRFVIERDGRVVAEAWSSRVGAHAAEVEVETHSDYRRRGYGRQVTAAWAYQTRRSGKVAFYSHLTSNAASRALAASVGAVWFADTRELFPQA